MSSDRLAAAPIDVLWRNDQLVIVERAAVLRLGISMTARMAPCAAEGGEPPLRRGALGQAPGDGSIGATGISKAGRWVPPSTRRIVPVTQDDAGEAR